MQSMFADSAIHPPRFHAAAFAIDGELMNQSVVGPESLSPNLYEACCTVFQRNGPIFRTNLEGKLGHIAIKLTSDNGAGLGMFYVHGQLALSTAYFSGTSPTVDSDVQTMFLASLRNTHVVVECAATLLPFEALLSLGQRPLQVAIPWGLADITDVDHQLVRDLSSHFAAAFFAKHA